MGQQEQLRSVIHLYETHRINQQQILHNLGRDGIELTTLTEEILKDDDQDHFGGLKAVEIPAEKTRSRRRFAPAAKRWRGRSCRAHYPSTVST